MSLRSILPVALLSLVPLTAITLPGDAQGRKLEVMNMDMGAGMAFGEQAFFGGGGFVADFTLQDMPLGGVEAPQIGPHAGSHGSTLVADGRGLLTLDRDSGELVRSDRRGQALARLKFHSDAGELVWDGNDRVYVADRTDGRVAVVNPGDALGQGLKVVDGFKIREPHGLALTPDGKTLLVTSVTEQALVAVDTATLTELWRLDLAQEPRSVAVSADGKQALVGFLSTGAVAMIDISGARPSSEWLALDPALPTGVDPFSGQLAFNEFGMPASPSESQDVGRRFARNAFAVGFIGDGLAVIPHQLSTPHLPSNGGEDSGTYGGGGGFLAPITHRVAMIDTENAFAPKTAFVEIGLHQPRALAYDLANDTLYLAGYGDDRVMAIADVSRSSIHLAWTTSVANAGSCAPDGIAFEGKDVWVHCELGRRVVAIDTSTVDANFGAPTTSAGPELASTTLTDEQQRGADLFRRGRDHRVSVGGFMACASCHPEGRTDGLSWRIEGHNLQTPVLAGRVAGTHPYKWDGKDVDLPTSLSNTVGRLGGTGLTPDDVRDLRAFLENLPQPKPPLHDQATVARGKALFESEDTACSACHDGAKLSDGQQYDFATNLVQVDTPSLVGLAYSAPYYHDGSARTLRALLTDKATVHGMGKTSQLDDAQIDDLITYLESL
jgi:DNA-binding beta-propeller fold protein YncE